MRIVKTNFVSAPTKIVFAPHNKENFTYSLDTMYNDSKDWQKWDMKDDTLIFYGLEKAELADGRDVTKE